MKFKVGDKVTFVSDEFGYLDVFNGDTGVVLHTSISGLMIRVYFDKWDDSLVPRSAESRRNYGRPYYVFYADTFVPSKRACMFNEGGGTL